MSTKPPTFEDAVNEIQRIISNIENGELTLKQSIEAFDRGRQLLEFCQNELKQAQTTIEIYEQNASSALEHDDV